MPWSEKHRSNDPISAEEEEDEDSEEDEMK